jgi:hypothetical protein
MSEVFGIETGKVVISVLGIVGGWLALISQQRIKTFDTKNTTELAARNMFRHSMGAFLAFVIAVNAAFVFLLIGFRYFSYDGIAVVSAYSIQFHVTSLGWFIVHLLSLSALFAGSILYGLEEMDIEHIHYLARLEVLSVPNAPDLSTLSEAESEESEESEAEEVIEEEVEDDVATMLQKILERLEALEARFDAAAAVVD